MNEKKLIRDFDFFRSFEKPKNVNELKKSNKKSDKVNEFTQDFVEKVDITLKQLVTSNDDSIKKSTTKSVNNIANSKAIKNFLVISIIVTSTFYLYYDSIEKMDELSVVLSAEQEKINKNINDFTVKNIVNTFVAKNFQDCTSNLKGAKEVVENQCKLYVLNLAETSDSKAQLNKHEISSSLENFQKLSKISPEVAIKSEKIINSIKITKIINFFSGK